MVPCYSDRTLHFTPRRVRMCCACWPQCSLHSASRLKGVIRPKHVALSCMALNFCVLRYIPLYFNFSKHNRMNMNKCVVLWWVGTDFYINYFKFIFNLWSWEPDNLVARIRKQIGFRNKTVRDRKWQSVGRIRQLDNCSTDNCSTDNYSTDNCSTDNAMRMDPLNGYSNKEQ